jgi:5-deoxy-glucuronate isomerase
MNLHIKSPSTAPGVYPIARRGHDLKYLSFTIVELGGSLPERIFESGDEEFSLDSYTGAYEVTCEGAQGRWTAQVPARASITAAHPMIYLPAQSKITLKTLNGPARITIGGAAGKPGAQPAIVEGKEIIEKSVGKDNWNRTVYTHIADNIPASHLICGETVNRPGGWSSCPPHKHDRFGDGEVPMEEIYYFQIDPPQGVGFMRVYTQPDDPNPFDYAYPVQHGDTVLIPRGYHPVVACPGYALNYTWILAGEGRTYGAWKDDPRHSWIKNN